MTIPLGVLAIGSIFAGMIWYGSFFGDHAKMVTFFAMPEHAAVEAPAATEAAPATTAEAPAAGATAPAADAAHAEVAHGAPQGAIYMSAESAAVLDAAHHAPTWVKASPFIAMLIGLALSYLFYIVNPSLPRRLAASQPILYRFLLNKWYFDEIYDVVFVRFAKWLGNVFWKRGDGSVIDGTINGVAMGIIPFFTRLAGRMQSGYLFHYAFAMVIGIAVLLTWMTLSGGAH